MKQEEEEYQRKVLEEKRKKERLNAEIAQEQRRIQAQMEKEQSSRHKGDQRQESIQQNAMLDSAVMERIADLAKFEANKVKFQSIEDMDLNPNELARIESALDNVKERDLVK